MLGTFLFGAITLRITWDVRIETRVCPRYDMEAMMKAEKRQSAGPDQNALDIAAAVQKAVSPATVILFGSRALGSHTDSSDIDLLVIADGQNTRAPELIARRTAGDFMMVNPPKLDADVIVMTREEFARCRLANQHVAGQAANLGVVMSGQGLNSPAENNDNFPDHWPETRQRLENVLEYQFHFNQMLDENIQNQRLMGFLGQQALENALKGWLSTWNDRRTFGHELVPLWDDVRPMEDWVSPAMQELQQDIDLLFDYTKYEDPQALGITLDWLTLYAARYRYSRPSHRMTREERSELQERMNPVLNGIMERIHQRSGTSPDDLWVDGIKPWDEE